MVYLFIHIFIWRGVQLSCPCFLRIWMDYTSHRDEILNKNSLLKNDYHSRISYGQCIERSFRKPNKTYKLKLFAKIMSSIQPLTIFSKSSILVAFSFQEFENAPVYTERTKSRIPVHKGTVRTLSNI